MLRPDSELYKMQDHRQFVELLGRQERQLNAYVLSLVPNWADADEIVQETRIALWDQFEDYDPEKSFAAWARAIAYYQVLSHRKRQSRLSPLLSNETLELLAQDFAEQASENLQRQDALERCLASMKTPSRKLLARCYTGEETVKEIAAALGRSYVGLRQTLFRMRTALYECVERKLGSGEQSP